MSIPLTHPQNVFKKQENLNMSDLNEKLAQEAAADRIEKLEAALREIVDLSKGMPYLLGFTPADIARKALDAE